MKFIVAVLALLFACFVIIVESRRRTHTGRVSKAKAKIAKAKVAKAKVVKAKVVKA